MSQSQSPTDSQALVQSMLQRLKLQPGREGHAYLQTRVPITDASTSGQDGERGAPSLQKVNNSSVSDFGKNGIPSKESRISTVDTNFGLKGSEVDGVLISYPSQKDNIDGDTVEKRVLGQATWPKITPTGTGQLFPVKSLKEADIASFQRTEGERVSIASSATTKHTPPNTDTASTMGPNQNLTQGFTPRVYAWSLRSTDTDTGGQQNKVLHVGNGGFDNSAQMTTNSSFRRKQQSSEKKTRRWTAKITEKWRDRQGSFGKKEKKGGIADQKNAQGSEISPPNHGSTAKNPFNTSSKDGEETLPSLDSSKTPPAHAEDSTVDGHIRSTSDFEFGLGSFSLLEEIVKGQEWAVFLNPNLSAAPENQTPPEKPLSQPKIQPNPYNVNQAPGNLNQRGGGSNQWSFRRTESSPAAVFTVGEISPSAFQPVSMDVTEGKQTQNDHRQADQSEPMEDGHNQSDMQPGENGLGQQFTPLSSVEPTDNKPNQVVRSRIQLNRKRQHQSAEKTDERLETEKMSDEEANREGSMIISNTMDETGESQHDKIMPHSQPTPFSPNPNALPPRGVLKHSISRDSECSIQSKRRRVEENRRVRFSEEVVTIASPDLDLDFTDSEEEEEESEESSVTEQEGEVEQVVMEEVAPARRPALPNWILALKRKNTGRKHR